MQVFKAFFKVLRKNSMTAVIFIGIFLLISVMSATQKADIGIRVDIRMAVFDEDCTPESEKLTELLGEKYTLRDAKNDKDYITDMLYYEAADYALVINRGYSEKLANGDTSGLFSSYHMHDSYGAVIVEQFLDDYAATVSAYTAAGLPLDKAIENAGADLLTETEVTIETFDDSNNDYSSSFSSYFKYMPYILISAILSALCPVLMIMNRKDIRYRTNCSSVAPNSYTFQIFAGGAVFVLAVWLIFIVAGLIIYGGIFRGKAWTAVLNSGLFALITTAMAVLIASIISSQKILTLIVQILGLGMSFLCGIFVPQSMLSDGVLAVGRFLPTYWYIYLNDMLSGAAVYSSEKAAMCLLIEAGYAAALLLVTLLIRRLRYSSSQIITAVKAS